MLPSDHFVRMYNELFKMLKDRSMEDIKKYWLEVSSLQKSLLGPYIEKDGLEGMRKYWDHIRIEENCEMDLEVTEDYFEFVMKKCPSLSKNLDNDAGLCELYCDHCAGWINPVIRSFGYYPVYDMISRTKPVCRFRAYRDIEKAREWAKDAELLAQPYQEDRISNS